MKSFFVSLWEIIRDGFIYLKDVFKWFLNEVSKDFYGNDY